MKTRRFPTYPTAEKDLSPRDKVRVLGIFSTEAESHGISRFLDKWKVEFQRTPGFENAERLLLDSQWDLVIFDADIPEGNVAGFMAFCRARHLGLPIVGIHRGALGSRSASLIRMGAFDAFPRDLDRHNALVFLERAVMQARIIKQLLHLSRTDHLTGLYNQRFLYESLEKEMLRARRTVRPFTVALLDMDHFKAFNDNFGHLEGDRTLFLVGHALSRSIRAGVDSAFRYGGDEFLLLFPETAPPEASRVIARVLAAVKADCKRRVTFSIGVVNGESFRDVAALMKAVDEAMYMAKSSGGARISVRTFAPAA